ncbi:MAG TPA: tRNA (adenosine(37)-N6)-dimethylallyltransferase MiaA [Candidatus Saccharimonadales bacterium]|nr:tRNA (adenosine(37)-N6)-dimethylallyltransferase MiaA [Candidatus Saccharimonadales bacterium]
MATRPELLAIVGVTASGKSDLSMKVAREFSGEIISADSWTVYKGFDIGTGKPSAADQKAVRHHLLDVRGPTDGFNAPLFKEMAEKAIKNIQKRGKLPILAGGTGLYIDSVLYDYGFLPNTSTENRAKLNSMSLSKLLERAKVEGVDLTGVDSRNKRRVVRAIEAGGAKPSKSNLKKGTLIVGLQIDNDQLRRRVEQRTKRMLNAGLETEVRSLADKYGWDIEPMKGIGYQQWSEYFDGRQSLEETKNRLISATMNLAKRQRTWFKRDKNIQWFDSADEAYRFISCTLNT